MTKSAEYFENMFSRIDEEGDAWGHQWRASQKIRHQLCFKTFAYYLDNSHAKKVLDLGTGQADILSELQKRYPQHSYFGTDISAAAITWCQKSYPDIQFKQAVLPEIGFKDSFDIISAFEVLYYLTHEEQNQALKNIHNALTTKGVAYISAHLDGGINYWDLRGATRLINTHFNIQNITYCHNKLYGRFEKPVLRLYHIANHLSHHSLSASESNLKKCLKTLFPKHSAKFITRLILENEKLAYGLQGMAKHFFYKEDYRSHVIFTVSKQ